MAVCPRACNFCVSLPMVIVNWIKLSEAFDFRLKCILCFISCKSKMKRLKKDAKTLTRLSNKGRTFMNGQCGVLVREAAALE